MDFFKPSGHMPKQGIAKVRTSQERRDFLKQIWKFTKGGVLAGALGGTGFGIYGYHVARSEKYIHRTIRSSAINTTLDGTVMVHLSDLHIDPHGTLDRVMLRRIVEKILVLKKKHGWKEVRIILSGDIVNKSVSEHDYQWDEQYVHGCIVEELSKLAEETGIVCYFTKGNHDLMNVVDGAVMYSSEKGQKVRAMMEAAGWNYLAPHTVIHEESLGAQFVGFPDFSSEPEVYFDQEIPSGCEYSSRDFSIPAVVEADDFTSVNGDSRDFILGLNCSQQVITELSDTLYTFPVAHDGKGFAYGPNQIIDKPFLGFSGHYHAYINNDLVTTLLGFGHKAAKAHLISKARSGSGDPHFDYGLFSDPEGMRHIGASAGLGLHPTMYYGFGLDCGVSLLEHDASYIPLMRTTSPEVIFYELRSS